MSYSIAQKRIMVAVCGLCLFFFSFVFTLTAQAAQVVDPDAEITPWQYSALLSLRELNPATFKTTWLPLLQKALQNDNKITNAELQDIEQRIGSLGNDFGNVVNSPSWQERLDSGFESAKEKGLELGQEFNQHVAPLVDEAFKMFQEKLKPTPQAAPATEL